MGIFKKNAFGITIFLDFIYDFFFPCPQGLFSNFTFCVTLYKFYIVTVFCTRINKDRKKEGIIRELRKGTL